MDVFSTQVNDFHKITTIFTESFILDFRRDPEQTSAMILPNKSFYIRLKQLPKIFKMSYLAGSRSSTSTNTNDETICKDSLQLKSC